MFLKILDKKQKFNLKNLKRILIIGWHSDLHGKMNLNINNAFCVAIHGCVQGPLFPLVALEIPL